MLLRQGGVQCMADFSVTKRKQLILLSTEAYILYKHYENRENEIILYLYLVID